MEDRKNIIIFIALFLLFSSVYCKANDFKDFTELDLESMLNTEVVSASKKLEKRHEAPNAIYVITEEDIKNSGAVDLPDLFRMVPGVDVVSIYGNSYGVSARGFNERYAQRMLVLIDGRSIYTTFFGGVFWEDYQIFLEDISRIEVIRGPGATLWGANSANGVINIITKDPEEDQGFLLTTKAGTKNYRQSIFRFSESVSEALSFSIVGGYGEDEGTRGTNDFRRVPKANSRIKFKLSENSILDVFAGINESEMGLDVTKYTHRTDANIRSNYQMIHWQYSFSDTSQLNTQAYRSSYEIHSEDKFVMIDEDKYDVEIQHSFMLGSRNYIMWGANYRNTKIDSIFLSPKSNHDDLVGFFLQDEIHFYDNLKLVAGIKYEKNSFTGWDYSPRASVLYSPSHKHHFRFTVSRAFRTPSFVEDGFRMVRKLHAHKMRFPLALVEGNEHMDPEEMTAYEIGYYTMLYNKLSLNVELYYNNLDHVIENVINRGRWPFIISWDNSFNAISKGMEITTEFPATPWWTIKANYTFQEVEYKRVNQDVPGTPRHKFNIGSCFTFENGFSMNMNAHYVDDTKWSGLTGNVKTDDYIRLDIRIAQKLLGGRLELALVGQNLLDNTHPETSDVTGTYETERLIYGQMTVQFK